MQSRRKRPGGGTPGQIDKTSGRRVIVDPSIPFSGSPVNIHATRSYSVDLIALLGQARRRYDRAVSVRDWGGAARHKRIYNALFERRRRILLAQGARLAGGGAT